MSEDFYDLLLDMNCAPERLMPTAKAFKKALESELRERKVQVTSIVAAYASCILSHLLHVLDLEAEYAKLPWLQDIRQESCVKAGGDGTPAEPVQRVTGKDSRLKREEKLVWLDAIGKEWERLRKAMKDFAEHCGNMGTPIDIGLADLMKPTLEAAEGVLEDATAFEARRTAANAASEKKRSAKPRNRLG